MLDLPKVLAGQPGNSRLCHTRRTGPGSPVIAALVLVALAVSATASAQAVSHITTASKTSPAILAKAEQAKRQKVATGSRPATSKSQKARPVHSSFPQAAAKHGARPGSIQQAVHRPTSGSVGRRPLTSRPTAGQAAQKRGTATMNNLFSGLNRPGTGSLPFSIAMPSFNFPSFNLGQLFQQQPVQAQPVSQRPQPAPMPITQPVSQQVPAPVSQPASQPGPTTVGDGDPFQAQELNLINQYRQQNGHGPLAVDPNLTGLAVGHSQDMANRQSMDHNGFDQRFQQAQQWGYTHCVENVAWNYNDPQSLFTAWQNSPEHNLNMLDSAIQKAGVSIVNGYSTFLACN